MYQEKNDTVSKKKSERSRGEIHQFMRNQAEQTKLEQNNSMNGAPAQFKTIQKKTDNRGLPAQLQAGIEGLSGCDMSDVRVHRNSNKPAQLNAHAYAQGPDVYLGPGQERHLPHEAWHVAQQKQGRVPTTVQMKGDGIGAVNVNDNPRLELEADVMGAKAMALGAQMS